MSTVEFDRTLFKPSEISRFVVLSSGGVDDSERVVIEPGERAAIG